MDFGITNKVALVAAASKGLGRGAAKALAAEGCRVAIFARHNDQVEQTAEELTEQTGGEVIALSGDVTDADAVGRILNEVRNRLGPISILVTNAGGPPPGGLDRLDDEHVREAFELNGLASIRLAREVAGEMKQAGWGRIVMITSTLVAEPSPTLALSALARSAATAVMKSLSKELAGEGVTVNAVMPGGHLTDRAEQLMRDQANRQGIPLEDIRANAGSDIPAGHLGNPEDFGAVVAFLCSRQANFVTGVNLAVDGGACGGY